MEKTEKQINNLEKVLLKLINLTTNINASIHKILKEIRDDVKEIKKAHEESSNLKN